MDVVDAWGTWHKMTVQSPETGCPLNNYPYDPAWTDTMRRSFWKIISPQRLSVQPMAPMSTSGIYLAYCSPEACDLDIQKSMQLNKVNMVFLWGFLGLAWPASVTLITLFSTEGKKYTVLNSWWDLPLFSLAQTLKYDTWSKPWAFKESLQVTPPKIISFTDILKLLFHSLTIVWMWIFMRLSHSPNENHLLQCITLSDGGLQWTFNIFILLLLLFSVFLFKHNCWSGRQRAWGLY